MRNKNISSKFKKLLSFDFSAALGGHVSAAVWLGLFASAFAAAFLVWARDDENIDDVDDEEEDNDDDDEDEDDGGGGDQQQQKRKATRRRKRRRRRRRRRTLLTTRTSRRRWTAAVRTTLVVTTILRLILSVGPEPTLWLLGLITVYFIPFLVKKMVLKGGFTNLNFNKLTLLLKEDFNVVLYDPLLYSK